ncbi:MAG: hypothetical protein MSA47_03350 [Christensenellaceae bacterium]|nr:hypothetical protein [Christensenellaceae bacterium]
MKKKFLLVALSVIFVSALTASLCACAKTDEGNAIEYGIEIENYPRQYYTEGERFSPDGGTVKVFLRNDVTGKEETKVVDMTDGEIVFENVNGGRVGETYTATVKYHGFQAKFRYAFFDENEAVESVTLDVPDDFAPLVYAKSDLRDNFEYEDLNGLTITIKYRNEQKPDKVFMLDDEMSYYTKGVSQTGFDVKETGRKNIVFSCLASDFKVSYDVVENDWIESFYLTDPNGETGNADGDKLISAVYFTGDSFNAGGAKIVYVYNSLKESDPVDIESRFVKNFDTTDPVTNAEMTIAPLGNEAYCKKFNYKVFVHTDVTDMRAQSGNKILDVNDTSVTFEEFLGNVKVFMAKGEGEGAVTVEFNGNDPRFKYFYFDKDGNELPFDENSYKEIIKKGQSLSLKVVLKDTDVSFTDDDGFFAINIVKKWIRTEITGWDSVKTEYGVGEDFDFGGAKIKAIYDDGTWDEENLVDIYAATEKEREDKWYKNLFKKRTVNSFVSVGKFDLSKAGTYDASSYKGETGVSYCLDVQGDDGVYIDGILQTGDVPRIYLVFTVR